MTDEFARQLLTVADWMGKTLHELDRCFLCGEADAIEVKRDYETSEHIACEEMCVWMNKSDNYQE